MILQIASFFRHFFNGDISRIIVDRNSHGMLTSHFQYTENVYFWISVLNNSLMGFFLIGNRNLLKNLIVHVIQSRYFWI